LTELLHLAHAHNVPALVDGKGLAFELALKSPYLPWCIKPNTDEAAELLHRPIENEVAEVEAVRELLGLGIQVVILSCGERGAYLGTNGSVWFYHSPKTIEVSPVGSGDALVGAFLARYLETSDLHDAMGWGIAAGAANAGQVLPAFCKRGEIENLLHAVYAKQHI
jgi:fructose-1-phosphate kinase PfkB-like protein